MMAKKMKYSIGYNNDVKMLELLSVYSENIESLYFPMPTEYLASGRFRPFEKDYKENIPWMLNVCEENGINSQILLNASCEGDLCGDEKHMKKTVEYLKMLAKVGLRSATVVNPFYITELKRNVPELEIHSSVNCYTAKIEDALYLRDMGVDVLAVDRDINRNIELIREIKKTAGLPVKILLNEGCLSNCPFRRMHFNAIAHRIADRQFLNRSCITVIRKDPKKLFRIPFVRPEDVRHYKGLADYFKLATRTFTTQQIENTLKAYINEEYNGDLLDILDMTSMKCFFTFVNNKVLDKMNFFENMQKCTLDCDKCGYCESLLKKAVILNKGNKKPECKECSIYPEHVEPYSKLYADCLDRKEG